MPKVQTKANVADGSFTTIDVPTNRQGAEKARIAAHEDPKKAPAANSNGAALAEPAKAAPSEPPNGSAAPGASPAATEPPAEDPNDTGLEDDDKELAERAQKKIAKKHREMRQAEALATKLRAELADTEDFSKSQYNRARLAEERLAELQAELEALKAKPGDAPAAAPSAPKKPEIKDFYDDKGQFKFAEYTEAVAEYSAQKALADERAKRDADEKKAREERAERERAEAEALAAARIAEAKKRYPDYDQKLESSTVKVHNVVSAYLAASERIGDLTYYLAANPDYAEKLNKMHPLAAVAEIGRLEAKWIKSDPPPAPKGEEGTSSRSASAAPAPITPLPGMGSAGVTTDPSKMTPVQLRDYDRERKAAKLRARH